MSGEQSLQATALIKSTARSLGFDYCGISRAEYLSEEAPRVKHWLEEKQHGQMGYMENHFDKRLDPNLLVEGARSVVSLLYNYCPESELNEREDDNFKIARYAYGEDYHSVLKNKLKKFLSIIKDKYPDVNGRVFVDSAPVMERQWAARSGLGWIGKNTLLINKESGSYFFIAELIINIELEYDSPLGDFCGTCTRCIDACPTQALGPYRMDASKCISYLTIELREEIPGSFKGKTENWIFGCDICQEVCPWNRFSKPHNEPSFLPNAQLRSMKRNDWIEITEEIFRALFRKSPVKRARYKGLMRNIKFNQN